MTVSVDCFVSEPESFREVLFAGELHAEPATRGAVGSFEEAFVDLKYLRRRIRRSAFNRDDPARPESHHSAESSDIASTSSRWVGLRICFCFAAGRCHFATPRDPLDFHRMASTLLRKACGVVLSLGVCVSVPLVRETPVALCVFLPSVHRKGFVLKTDPNGWSHQFSAASDVSAPEPALRLFSARAVRFVAGFLHPPDCLAASLSCVRGFVTGICDTAAPTSSLSSSPKSVTRFALPNPNLGDRRTREFAISDSGDSSNAPLFCARSSAADSSHAMA